MVVNYTKETIWKRLRRLIGETRGRLEYWWNMRNATKPEDVLAHRKDLEERYTYEEYLVKYFPKTEEEKFQELYEEYKDDPQGLGREMARRAGKKLAEELAERLRKEVLNG